MHDVVTPIVKAKRAPRRVVSSWTFVEEEGTRAIVFGQSLHLVLYGVAVHEIHNDT